MFFKRQDELVERPLGTLKSIAGHFGMSMKVVEACEQHEAITQKKIKADQQFAVDQRRLGGRPTFLRVSHEGPDSEPLRISWSDFATVEKVPDSS